MGRESQPQRVRRIAKESSQHSAVSQNSSQQKQQSAKTALSNQLKQRRGSSPRLSNSLRLLHSSVFQRFGFSFASSDQRYPRSSAVRFLS
jgi:hypothetical protein